MNYEKIKQKVKDNRNLLTEILQSEGLTTFRMAEFAIEEYMLGENCGKYDYHNFREDFETRILHGNDGRRPKFGKLMTETLSHFFNTYLDDVYILVKKIVYQKMDELDNNDELWTIDNFCATFEDWVGAWAEEIVHDDENFPIDFNDFNIDEKKLKKYKLKVSVNKEKELVFEDEQVS